MSAAAATPRDASRINEFIKRLQQHGKQASSTPAGPRIISAGELLAMKLEKPKFIVEDFLTGPGAWLLVGAHKSGKTVLAAQLAICYQAGQAFLDYYAMREAGRALFIEQDDPAGLATLQEILKRSPVPIHHDRWFTVESPQFTIGEDFVGFLAREISSRAVTMVILDSYTALRRPRKAGADLVKADMAELRLLDELGKATGCTILLIHHRARRGNRSDWAESAAGTYAVSAAVEGEIHISRFPELPATADERLLQVRGRRLRGLELVVRFRPETYDYEFVLEGPASQYYPELERMRQVFADRTFSGKDICTDLGLPRPTAYRMIARLLSGGVLIRSGYGKYKLAT
jgi:hypothetical protein